MSAPKSAIQINGQMRPEYAQRVLTPEALTFLAELHQRFNGRRLELLARRNERQEQIQHGKLPDFLDETRTIRESDWQVGPTPDDLRDRRVEITGPAEAKMMINALNSGAQAFMCDFEDSLSPTWDNILQGQINLQDAVRRQLVFKNEAGKQYALNPQVATLLVRPRGWHLPEKHLTLAGERLSASLVDFGLYFFHNAQEALARGSGPYFYLPKLESHLEARLWNDVFDQAQDLLGIPRGQIKVTVLIETIMTAFEMDEILYELRDHITGLNAGRWDYIFSIIKKFQGDANRVLPDRAQVTMSVPFMRAYCDLLVKTCHARGAHAMGGMAAFIPSRKDAEVNRVALAKVREDKEREVQQGFDGTWVAHPDLVPVAGQVFTKAFGSRPNQKERQRPDVRATQKDLLTLTVPGGQITADGIANNIDVALQYIDYWLAGSGAVAIHDLMEDAATAEIARAQLWQWIHHEAALNDGRRATPSLYSQIRNLELTRLEAKAGKGHYARAGEILDGLVLDQEFASFLTLPAYEKLP